MTAPSTTPTRAVGFCLLLALLTALPAAAQTVRWEDYRGIANSSGLANVTYTGPASAPTFNHTLAGVTALRALSSNPANAVRTGNAVNIDFRNVLDDSGLCDNRTAAGRNTAACSNHAMGKVIYSLIRFPNAGTYTLGVAHDDAVEVNLSSSYTNTNYRAATYDVPVGALTSYTDGETTYRTVGSFNAATANSCALIRVYWVNAGGQNFNRLRWQHPAINGGTPEIIPAAQFRDPAAAASSAGCQGSVVFPVPSIMINKVVAGRIAAADQFTVSILQGTTAIRSASTTGSGTGLQASTCAAQVGTGTHTLRDAMATGSAAAIADYSKTISCTAYVLNGADQVVTPTGSGPDWSINVAANTQYTCTITNTPRPSVTVRKISEGGIGTFAFTGSNGIAAHSITTTSAGQAVAGPPQVFASLNTATTLTEAQTAGYSLTDVQCSGLPAGLSATVDLANRRVTLPAAAAVQGASIVCTFTNKAGADLSVSKTNAVTSLVSGTTTRYAVVARNAGPGDASDAVLRDVPGSGLKNCTVTTCSATNGAACPATLSNLLTPAGVAISPFPVNGQVELQVQCTVE